MIAWVIFMHNFRRALFGVCIVFIVVVLLIFTLENQQSTSLTFFGWSSTQLPVAAYLLLAFLFGMVAGPLLAWLFGRKSDRRI